MSSPIKEIENCSLNPKMIRPFLTAEWRNLIIFNYQVTPALLKDWIPNGTELDDRKDVAYVSLVGFHFQNTKVWGIKFPFHHTFEEVNLRFYVRRESKGELRRGVVFIKEIVPRRLISAIARTFYGEPYEAMPMHHKFREDSFEYTWSYQNQLHSMKIEIEGQPQEIPLASEAEFITEHYWGYNGRPGHQTIEYPVHHPRWRVWKSKNPLVTANIHNVYGEQWKGIFSQGPSSTVVAEGSEISVGFGRTV